jgi:uncharacterized protein (TIGR02680 family)
VTTLFDDPANKGQERGALPALPVPTRARFQPLRMGLVELFHYDVEEFWFRDGHLLLRGNNGTGKSKVLSLTLPFLLDASLSATRVEPDGDRTKRMEWNLLLGRYERRLGYAWIEFGRLTDDGQPAYVTLGCGMRAVAGRPRVESWNFLTDQRVGEELALITPERMALTRERLEAALTGRGRVYETAAKYRRAVDERLFRLGERYDALIDTLIQLRQPQLSKKPDEQSLSDALSNAMPEVPRAVLDDVAEAMNQLDAYRDELTHIERVREALGQFMRRYERYTRVQARRRAGGVRRAQTEFDKQSQLVNASREARTRAEDTARQCAHEESTLAAVLGAARAQRDELQGDPTMSDARRLTELEAQAKRAESELKRAEERAESLRAHWEREHSEGRRLDDEHRARNREATALAESCLREAKEAGCAKHHLACLAERESGGAAHTSLEHALASVRERRLAQVLALRERHAELGRVQAALAASDAGCAAHRDHEAHAERCVQASERGLEDACSAHAAATRACLDGLRVLTLPDAEAALLELDDWLRSQQGDHPIRGGLEAAAREELARLADAASVLQQARTGIAAEERVLSDELAALRAGVQGVPAPAPTRDATTREGRPGAPLWRLFDFHDHVPAAARAGIEAALEGAGLLDAWVTPEAAVLHPDTRDAWLEPAAARPSSLAAWLVPVGDAVPAARLAQLLASIACGADDDADALAYVSPAGNYRVGLLRGAHAKAEPQFLGEHAREAARKRRVAVLEAALLTLNERRTQLDADAGALAERRARLEAERASLPSDEPVRSAHAERLAAQRQWQAAQAARAQAEQTLEATRSRLRAAREALVQDAHDLELPEAPDALLAIEAALTRYACKVGELRAALAAEARAEADVVRQTERVRSASERYAAAEADAAEAGSLRRDAQARHQVLLASAGAKVRELDAKLRGLAADITRHESALGMAREACVSASEELGRAGQRVLDAESLLEERSHTRREAVHALEGFAGTGLLAIALPELTLPEPGWTIDPALALARRVEQQLTHVPSEDADWTRVQNEVSRDYTALGQALSALGQHTQMEQTDHGLVVHVSYAGRPERPDLLARRLDDEAEQRRGILSAREREILENHLSAEIAANLARLLRDAEAQVARINTELKRRPTSTGVYFRLDWEPRVDDLTDASFAGLLAVRKLLTHKLADAWSSDERRTVGDFLAARIRAERERGDQRPLIDHLTRALDYRAWHRFRVKRWHDGAFRPLSGPASSGERALGLTVPLFAAASSHYASAASPYAPRLVLLDEAFAGIDDEARAHCMGLIHEFDLDFVMTSEREWGCYATLPGVSICHILRREGVDAAFVSRWTWDGRARQRTADPTRRFGPSDPA